MLTVIASMIFAKSVFATPTGLNNIATADVVSEKTLVLQTIVDVGENNKPDYTTGFKYGLYKNLEFGLDGRVFPEAKEQETIKAQIKYRLELDDKTALAFGIANLGDRAKLGWEDYYLAITRDFDFLRVHIGGTLQRDNEGGFAGLDKTIKLLDRDLTLRTDLIQTNDAHDATGSIGFIYDVGYNFLVESWASFPTQSGKDTVTTIKLDYVIQF